MRHVAILALLATLPAHAEVPEVNPGHDLFHQYYKYWYNGRGTHCCNEQHCRPAQPGKFRFHNGAWQVILGGEWRTLVETDLVIDDGGLGTFGSICHAGTYLYCVDLPDPSM